MPFMIRDANSADIPAIAHLHVRTYNKTHAPIFKNRPSYGIRERQWRQAFQETDGNWFCFVIENESGELIGFAKGIPYSHPDQPDFSGELNKLYILRKYHRQGLGRHLLGHVARRFLSQILWFAVKWMGHR